MLITTAVESKNKLPFWYKFERNKNDEPLSRWLTPQLYDDQRPSR